jgi:hypothetical protein
MNWKNKQPQGDLAALVRAAWQSAPEQTPVLALADRLDENHPAGRPKAYTLPRGFVQFWRRAGLERRGWVRRPLSRPRTVDILPVVAWLWPGCWSEWGATEIGSTPVLALSLWADRQQAASLAIEMSRKLGVPVTVQADTGPCQSRIHVWFTMAG